VVNFYKNSFAMRQLFMVICDGNFLFAALDWKLDLEQSFPDIFCGQTYLKVPDCILSEVKPLPGGEFRRLATAIMMAMATTIVMAMAKGMATTTRKMNEQYDSLPGFELSEKQMFSVAAPLTCERGGDFLSQLSVTRVGSDVFDSKARRSLLALSMNLKAMGALLLPPSECVFQPSNGLPTFNQVP
jgi:hypothetical protein